MKKTTKDLGLFAILVIMQVILIAVTFRVIDTVLSDGAQSPWIFSIAIAMLIISGAICLATEEIFKHRIRPTFGFYLVLTIPFFLGLVLTEQFIAATFVAAYGLFWANTPKLGKLYKMILARVSVVGITVMTVMVITYI